MRRPIFCSFSIVSKGRAVTQPLGDSDEEPAAALDLRMPSSRPTSRPVGVGVATAAVAGAVVLARPEACSPPACIDLRN